MKQLIALLALSLAQAGFAGEYRSFIEGGYFKGEVEDSYDLRVLEFRGERKLDNWIIAASKEELTIGPVDLDIARVEATNNFLRLGGGYLFELHDHVTLAPRAGLALGRREVESRSDFDDALTFDDRDRDDGYFVALGLRTRVRPDLEAELDYRFTNAFSDRVNDWRVDLRYTLTPEFALGVGYRDYEGDSTIGVSLRWLN